MYAIALGGHKSADELKRSLNKQKTDPAAADFHQRVSDGFSSKQILDAERQLFAFFDRMEANLSDHT